LGTQKAQRKRHKKHKSISIFLCAFCVDFALFVFPDCIIHLPLGFYRRSNTESEKPLDSYSKTGAAPLVLKEKRGLEPD
jgi:hypothetical protein